MYNKIVTIFSHQQHLVIDLVKAGHICVIQEGSVSSLMALSGKKESRKLTNLGYKVTSSLEFIVVEAHEIGLQELIAAIKLALRRDLETVSVKETGI